MTTHELLELAALDALGLLDDDERDAFDRAFRAAPPALQAQVRREQTRIARDESMLPQVDPPIGLKARVLAAWREAVEAMSLRRRAAARFMPTLLPSRGVSPIWRAAAVGCAAASIVLGFATVTINNLFNQYKAVSQDNAMAAEWQAKFGATFERTFFDGKNTRFVQFQVAQDAPDFKGDATLLLDKNTKMGEFYCRDMRAGAEYHLVVLDEQGKVLPDPEEGGGEMIVLSFRCTEESASRMHQKIERKIDLESGHSLALIAIDPDSGKQTQVLRSL